MASRTRGEQELEDFDKVFRALAHESRRNVLTVLNARGGTMTAGEIVARFSSAWPTMTRHMQVLEEAGLIKVEKQGREQHYTLDVKRLRTVLGNWAKWFN